MSVRDLPLVKDPACANALAAQQLDDTTAFRYYVETMWDREHRDEAELDAIVGAIAADVTAAIDCTACANCCRSARVGLAPDDLPRLAQGLEAPREQVLARLIERDPGRTAGEWGIIRDTPCPLLKSGLCSIYAHRPDSCRDYPAFTPHFRWLMQPIFAGAGQCPIIYNVIERLKVRLGWR